MNEPNPVPRPVESPVEPPPPPAPVPPSPGLAPSNSTSASVVGGALATMIIYMLSMKGVVFPAGAESALAVLATALAGYLPASGRK